MLGLEAMEEKRFCVICLSDKTYVSKKGNKQWYNHNGWHCRKCHNKLFLNPKWHPITHKKRFNFKGKSIYLDENPRKGICSLCKKKIGDSYIDFDGNEKIIKHTHIHHIQYHDDDPFKDTVELCLSCHMKETWRLGQVNKSVR